MFVAATAIEEFWRKDEELLFLGRFCIRNLPAGQLEKLRYKILPNPWNDRERLYKAIEYLDGFSETALVQLAEYLNQYHGTRFDLKYWRVLVSPWLAHYLHVLYDRYTILNDALAGFPELETITIDAGSFVHHRDTVRFVRACSYDSYNLQLFSSLAPSLGIRCHSRRFDMPATDKKGSQTVAETLKNGLLRAESAVAGSVAKRDNIGMYSMYWQRKSLWNLTIQSGFKFVPFNLPPMDLYDKGSGMDSAARNNIAQIRAANPFEKIFWTRFAADLPRIYLESYKHARELVLSGRQSPGTLMADSSWYFDEPFKFFAAEAQSTGKRLFVSQHGGGYGISRYTAGELHETRLADEYFVWGWADQRPGHRNLASPQMSRRKRGSHEGSSIVFVSTANPVYLLRFHSCPLGDQWMEYFNWQRRFLRATGKRESLIYRPYPADLGFNITAEVRATFPDVRVHHGSLWPELENAKLAVIDHCGTTFLETLASNIPTIVYWDPDRWEIRADAMSYFQRLIDCGILWPSPEEAAAATDRSYDNISGWWDSKEVQHARLAFTERFALRSENWIQDWRKVK